LLICTKMPITMISGPADCCENNNPKMATPVADAETCHLRSILST